MLTQEEMIKEIYNLLFPQKRKKSVEKDDYYKNYIVSKHAKKNLKNKRK